MMMNFAKVSNKDNFNLFTANVKTSKSIYN